MITVVARGPAARLEPKRDDLAIMVEDIRQAHDSYIPSPTPTGAAPTPPLAKPLPPSPSKPPPHPEKPKHGWLGGHLGIEHLLHLKGEVHQVTADAVDTALQPAAHLAPLSSGFLLTTASLGVASGGLGLILLKNGAEDVKEGLEHRDWRHTLEGVGSLIVGTRSLAAGSVVASHMLPNLHFAAEGAALAGKIMTPLGLVHGAIDAGLGLKDIVSGIQSENGHLITRGALGVGMGASLMTAAAGGGLPALASAGLFLGAKVWHEMATAESDQKPQP